MQSVNKKNFLIFLLKFFLLFSFLYFGTLIIIGLSSPGNQYSSFIAKYLDYVSGLKILLMRGTAVVASLFGYETLEHPNYIVRAINGRGVMIAFDCVGYGVMSFWIAFIIASNVRIKKTLVWLIGGLLIIYLINIFRIGLYLVALNKKWPMPLGLDHHTWFNIVVYIALFFMIWKFDMSKNAQLNSAGNK